MYAVPLDNDDIVTECDIAFVVVNSVMFTNAVLLELLYLHSATSLVVTVSVPEEVVTELPIVMVGATESAMVNACVVWFDWLFRSVQLTVAL